MVKSIILHLLLIKIEKYETGLVDFIKELCGLHLNQNLEKWLSLLKKFSLNIYYPINEFTTDLYYSKHDRFLNNINYSGFPIKNKIIDNHKNFIYKIKNKNPSTEYLYKNEICNKWNLYNIINPKYEFLKNYFKDYNSITKCDIIFWTNNIKTKNYILKDFHNKLEIIFHIPLQDSIKKKSHSIQGCFVLALANYLKILPLYYD